MSGNRHNVGLTVFVIAVYCFILIPLLIVIPISFNSTDAFDLPVHGLSFRWYWALYNSREFTKSLVDVSLVAGLFTMVSATLLGTLSALALVRCRFPGSNILEAFFLTPLIIPHILLGAAIYLYFSRLGFSASMVTLILGHILIATPYVIRSVTAGLVGLDRSIEEAAINLGANRWRTFFLVVVPQIKSSLVSGAIFAFIISFSDINIALFLSGPNTTTLPVHLFSQIQWESDPSIAAAATIQIAVIVMVIVFLRKLFKPRIVV
jgi:putative spermidine/putrescine transport system permease protein